MAMERIVIHSRTLSVSLCHLQAGIVFLLLSFSGLVRLEAQPEIAALTYQHPSVSHPSQCYQGRCTQYDYMHDYYKPTRLTQTGAAPPVTATKVERWTFRGCYSAAGSLDPPHARYFGEVGAPTECMKLCNRDDKVLVRVIGCWCFKIVEDTPVQPPYFYQLDSASCGAGCPQSFYKGVVGGCGDDSNTYYSMYEQYAFTSASARGVLDQGEEDVIGDEKWWQVVGFAERDRLTAKVARHYYLHASFVWNGSAAFPFHIPSGNLIGLQFDADNRRVIGLVVPTKDAHDHANWFDYKLRYFEVEDYNNVESHDRFFNILEYEGLTRMTAAAVSAYDTYYNIYYFCMSSKGGSLFPRARGSHLYGISLNSGVGQQASSDKTYASLLLSTFMPYPCNALEVNDRTHDLFLTLLDRDNATFSTVNLGYAMQRPCDPGAGKVEDLASNPLEWFVWNFQSIRYSRIHSEDAFDGLKLAYGVGAASTGTNSTFVVAQPKGETSRTAPWQVLEVGHYPHDWSVPASTKGSTSTVATLSRPGAQSAYIFNAQPGLKDTGPVIACIWHYEPYGKSSATVFLKIMAHRRGSFLTCGVWEASARMMNASHALPVPNVTEVTNGLNFGAMSVSVSLVRTQAGGNNEVAIPLKRLGLANEEFRVFCYDSQRADLVWPPITKGLVLKLQSTVSSFSLLPSFIWVGASFAVELANTPNLLLSRRVRVRETKGSCPLSTWGEIQNSEVGTDNRAKLVGPSWSSGALCYYETPGVVGMAFSTLISFAPVPPRYEFVVQGWVQNNQSGTEDQLFYRGLPNVLNIFNGPLDSASLIAFVPKAAGQSGWGAACGVPSSTVRVPVSQGARHTSAPISDTLRPMGEYILCYLGRESEAYTGSVFNPVGKPFSFAGPLMFDNVWPGLMNVAIPVLLEGRALAKSNPLTFQLQSDPTDTSLCQALDGNAKSHESIYYRSPTVTEVTPSAQAEGERLRHLQVFGVITMAASYAVCWFSVSVGRLEVYGPFHGQRFEFTAGENFAMKLQGFYPSTASPPDISQKSMVLVTQGSCGYANGTWPSVVVSEATTYYDDDPSKGSLEAVSVEIDAQRARILFNNYPPLRVLKGGSFSVCWAGYRGQDSPPIPPFDFNSSVATFIIAGPTLFGLISRARVGQPFDLAVVGLHLSQENRILFVEAPAGCGDAPNSPGANMTNVSIFVNEENTLQSFVNISFDYPVRARAVHLYACWVGRTPSDPEYPYLEYRTTIAEVFVTTAVVCGDGITTAPEEECDDGKQVPGDGCDQFCQIEPGWQVTSAFEGTTELGPICGDSLLRGREGCDDGNLSPGDGCSETCTVEAGWECLGEPSNCQPKCGDGLIIRNSSETCDDGNVVSGDGCNSLCEIEPGFNCTLTPIEGTNFLRSQCKTPKCLPDLPEGWYECNSETTPPQRLLVYCQLQQCESDSESDDSETVAPPPVFGCPYRDEGTGQSGSVELMQVQDDVYYCFVPPPPLPMNVHFLPDGRNLIVELDRDAMQTSKACDKYFDNTTILFGPNAVCNFLNFRQLQIALTNDAVIRPGDRFVSLPKAFILRVPDGKGPYDAVTSVNRTVLLVRPPPQGFEKPTLEVKAAESWNPCLGDLRLDASSSRGGLIEAAKWTWDCIESPFGSKHATYISDYLVDFADARALTLSSSVIVAPPPGPDQEAETEEYYQVMVESSSADPYRFRLTAKDRLGQSFETFVNVALNPSAAPALERRSPALQQAMPGEMVQVYAAALSIDSSVLPRYSDVAEGSMARVLIACGQYAEKPLAWEWAGNLAGSTTQMSTQMFEIADPSRLAINASRLSIGQTYTFTVTARYLGEVLASSIDFDVEILVPPVQAKILGGDLRQIGSSCEFMLDGSQTTWPQNLLGMQNISEEIRWTCISFDLDDDGIRSDREQPCQSFNGTLASLLDWKLVLNMPMGAFDSGQILRFTLSVTVKVLIIRPDAVSGRELTLSDQTFQDIQIVASPRPEIMVWEPAPYIGLTQTASLFAKIVPGGCAHGPVQGWGILVAGGPDVPIDTYRIKKPRSIRRLAAAYNATWQRNLQDRANAAEKLLDPVEEGIVLPWDDPWGSPNVEHHLGIVPTSTWEVGRRYAFRLTVNDFSEKPEDAMYSNQVFIQANTPPTDGFLKVLPQSGNPLVTTFQAVQSMWVVGDHQLPLAYWFGYSRRQNGVQLLCPWKSESGCEFVLSQGNISVVARAKDIFGDLGIAEGVQNLSWSVQVAANDPPLLGTEVATLVRSYSGTMTEAPALLSVIDSGTDSLESMGRARNRSQEAALLGNITDVPAEDEATLVELSGQLLSALSRAQEVGPNIDSEGLQKQVQLLDKLTEPDAAWQSRSLRMRSAGLASNSLQNMVDDGELTTDEAGSVLTIASNLATASEDESTLSALRNLVDQIGEELPSKLEEGEALSVESEEISVKVEKHGIPEGQPSLNHAMGGGVSFSVDLNTLRNTPERKLADDAPRLLQTGSGGNLVVLIRSEFWSASPLQAASHMGEYATGVLRMGLSEIGVGGETKKSLSRLSPAAAASFPLPQMQSWLGQKLYERNMECSATLLDPPASAGVQGDRWEGSCRLAQLSYASGVCKCHALEYATIFTGEVVRRTINFGIEEPVILPVSLASAREWINEAILFFSGITALVLGFVIFAVVWERHDPPAYVSTVRSEHEHEHDHVLHQDHPLYEDENLSEDGTESSSEVEQGMIKDKDQKETWQVTKVGEVESNEGIIITDKAHEREQHRQSTLEALEEGIEEEIEKLETITCVHILTHVCKAFKQFLLELAGCCAPAALAPPREADWSTWWSKCLTPHVKEKAEWPEEDNLEWQYLTLVRALYKVRRPVPRRGPYRNSKNPLEPGLGFFPSASDVVSEVSTESEVWVDNLRCPVLVLLTEPHAAAASVDHEPVISTAWLEIHREGITVWYDSISVGRQEQEPQPEPPSDVVPAVASASASRESEREQPKAAEPESSMPSKLPALPPPVITMSRQAPERLRVRGRMPHLAHHTSDDPISPETPRGTMTVARRGHTSARARGDTALSPEDDVFLDLDEFNEDEQQSASSEQQSASHQIEVANEVQEVVHKHDTALDDLAVQNILQEVVMLRYTHIVNLAVSMDVDFDEEEELDEQTKHARKTAQKLMGAEKDSQLHLFFHAWHRVKNLRHPAPLSDLEDIEESADLKTDNMKEQLQKQREETEKANKKKAMRSSYTQKLEEETLLRGLKGPWPYTQVMHILCANEEERSKRPDPAELPTAVRARSRWMEFLSLDHVRFAEASDDDPVYIPGQFQARFKGAAAQLFREKQENPPNWMLPLLNTLPAPEEERSGGYRVIVGPGVCEEQPMYDESMVNRYLDEPCILSLVFLSMKDARAAKNAIEVLQKSNVAFLERQALEKRQRGLRYLAMIDNQFKAYMAVVIREWRAESVTQRLRRTLMGHTKLMRRSVALVDQTSNIRAKGYFVMLQQFHGVKMTSRPKIDALGGSFKEGIVDIWVDRAVLRLVGLATDNHHLHENPQSPGQSPRRRVTITAKGNVDTVETNDLTEEEMQEIEMLLSGEAPSHWEDDLAEQEEAVSAAHGRTPRKRKASRTKRKGKRKPSNSPERQLSHSESSVSGSSVSESDSGFMSDSPQRDDDLPSPTSAPSEGALCVRVPSTQLSRTQIPPVPEEPEPRPNFLPPPRSQGPVHGSGGGVPSEGVGQLPPPGIAIQAPPQSSTGGSSSSALQLPRVPEDPQEVSRQRPADLDLSEPRPQDRARYSILESIEMQDSSGESSRWEVIIPISAITQVSAMPAPACGCEIIVARAHVRRLAAHQQASAIGGSQSTDPTASSSTTNPLIKPIRWALVRNLTLALRWPAPDLEGASGHFASSLTMAKRHLFERHCLSTASVLSGPPAGLLDQGYHVVNEADSESKKIDKQVKMKKTQTLTEMDVTRDMKDEDKQRARNQAVQDSGVAPSVRFAWMTWSLPKLTWAVMHCIHPASYACEWLPAIEPIIAAESDLEAPDPVVPPGRLSRALSLSFGMLGGVGLAAAVTAMLSDCPSELWQLSYSQGGSEELTEIKDKADLDPEDLARCEEVRTPLSWPWMNVGVIACSISCVMLASMFCSLCLRVLTKKPLLYIAENDDDAQEIWRRVRILHVRRMVILAVLVGVMEFSLYVFCISAPRRDLEVFLASAAPAVVLYLAVVPMATSLLIAVLLRCLLHVEETDDLMRLVIPGRLFVELTLGENWLSLSGRRKQLCQEMTGLKVAACRVYKDMNDKGLSPAPKEPEDPEYAGGRRLGWMESRSTVMSKSLSRVSLYSRKSTAQVDADDESSGDRRMSSKDSALSRQSSKLSRRSSKASNLGDQPARPSVVSNRSTDKRLTMAHDLTSELGRSEDSLPMWQGPLPNTSPSVRVDQLPLSQVTAGASGRHAPRPQRGDVIKTYSGGDFSSPRPGSSRRLERGKKRGSVSTTGGAMEKRASVI